MNRKELLYKLTGTEYPKFITERENKIIDITLDLINERERDSSEYIISASIWFNDGKIHREQPVNIKEGITISGLRHGVCFETAREIPHLNDIIEYENIKMTEGFITSKNRFVNRKEAVEIALKAKQIHHNYEMLISEHLY